VIYIFVQIQNKNFNLILVAYKLFFRLPGKRDIDGRLASAQTALMLQEETIRRNDRERKQMSDRIGELEQNLAGSEADNKRNEVNQLGLGLSLK
jgi:hypothetical protein